MACAYQVQVEVIKDYFHDDKPSQISTFFHPQPLRKREVDKLHKHVDKSADHAADAVRDGGADQEDRLGRKSLRWLLHLIQREQRADQTLLQPLFL